MLNTHLIEQDILPFRVLAEEVHDFPYPDEPSEDTELEEEDETGIVEARKTDLDITLEEDDGPPYPKPETEPEDPEEEEEVEEEIAVEEEPTTTEDIAMFACSIVIDMRRPRPFTPWPAPRPNEHPPVNNHMDTLAA